MKEQLEIIYQDQQLVAINKPSGLLVHRSPIDRRETRFALQLLRDQLGQRVYPLHRLDKPTSGVLLFALDAGTAARLNQHFVEQRVHKTYLAVVRGWPESHGLIDYPLPDRSIKGDYTQRLSSATPRSAVTHYRTLAQVELPIATGQHPSSRYALIEATPTTGRRHQLRRHFKHIFHPIIEDTAYGDGRHNQIFREHFNCSRLLLHASRLEVPHPQSDQPLSLQAALPQSFQAVLQSSGLVANPEIL